MVDSVVELDQASVAEPKRSSRSVNDGPWLLGIPMALSAWLVWPAIPSSAQSVDQRPNIIMILADDLGYSDVSSYNPASTPQVSTPSIDALASEGIRFTDGRTPDGVCTPTRYGLLTGNYSWRSRLKSGVLNGTSRSLIQPQRTTVASMLQSQGYHTGIIGKWHLGVDWVDSNGNPTTDPNRIDFSKPIQNGPTQLGFDSSTIISASLDFAPYGYIRGDRLTQMNGNPITNQSAQMQNVNHPSPQFGSVNTRDGWTVNDFDFSQVMPTIAQESAKYIAQRAADDSDSPFFLYVPFTGPHRPHVPSGAFPGANPGANTYGEFMADIDAAVGRIVDAVDAQGEEFSDNTLIVFSSDNGAAELQFGNHVGNAPFRGRKREIYEGGNRVPFIARWGNKVAANQVVDHRVALIDFTATVAEITGSALDRNDAVDSESFLGVLDGSRRQPVREAHVYHSFQGSFAIGSDNWKLLEDDDDGGNRPTSRRTPWQLFDIGSDAGETTNLIDAHPNKAVELSLTLDRYGPNSANGRSRTHRDILARFDFIDFQAGKSGSVTNPDVDQLTATNRLADHVFVSQGIHKGAGLSYVSRIESSQPEESEVLLRDSFENGSPGTSSGVNGGFTIQRNNEVHPVSLSESSGRMSSVVTDGGIGFPNGGPVSINSFNAKSFTAKFDVASISAEPDANGVFLGIVDDNSRFYRLQNNIGFSFFGKGSGGQESNEGFSFLVNDRDGAFDVLDSGENLDWASLANGFTATMSFDENGWSYQLSGVEGPEGSSYTNSGDWLNPNFYNQFFDNQEYVAASFQKDAAESVAFVFDQISVSGVPGALPNGAGRDRNDEFHLAGFDASSLEEAIAEEDYLAFSLSVDEGFEAADLLISIDLWRDNQESALNYELFTSVDGFTSSIASLVFDESDFGINIDRFLPEGEYGIGSASTLSGLLGLDNVITGDIEVRIYGYSERRTSLGAGGTHFIAARVEGLLRSSSVSVPEPTCFLFSIFAALFVALRRERS